MHLEENLQSAMLLPGTKLRNGVWASIAVFESLIQGFCPIVGVNSTMEGCIPVSMGPTLYKKKKKL